MPFILHFSELEIVAQDGKVVYAAGGPPTTASIANLCMAVLMAFISTAEGGYPSIGMEP